MIKMQGHKGSERLQDAYYQDPRAATVTKDDGLDLRSLALTLWRHKKLVAFCVISLTLLSAIIIGLITPRYTAESVVMIENRQVRIVDFETVLSGLNIDTSVVSSEVEVMRSRSLARRLIEKMNLLEDPEFNPDLQERKGWLSFLLRRGDNTDDMVAAERREAKMARAIDIFHSNLNILPITRSLVIKVRYNAADPRKAARIVNTLADIYIVDQLEAKFEATRLATMWLNDRLNTLRADVREKERAVEMFRRANQLIEVGGKEATSQQMIGLNAQVVVAKTELAEALARLESVRSLLDDEGTGDINSAPAVLNAPLIQRLKEEENRIVRRLSELSTRYGARHPSMLNVRAELSEIRRKINHEVTQIAKSLENEVMIAQVRLSTLEASLHDMEERQFGENQAMIELRELEREAESTRMLFETFLSRYKETSGQEDIQQADARIISRADIPSRPSYPKTTLLLLVAFIASCGVGVGAVFLVEHLDNAFKTAMQVEAFTGYPSLGMIPAINEADLEKYEADSIADYILDNPDSQVAEAVRTLRTSIMLSNIDTPAKILSVTSSVPNEGKTTHAVWLARTIAAAGQKTILIDCDLRRPTVHRMFGIDNKKSLVDVLAGEVKFSQAINVDEKTGLHRLPSRLVHASAVDLLSSEQMKNLLKILRREYDMIILDSPPCLAVSDARVIGQMADKTIYLVKWSSTPRDVVLAGLRQFHETGNADVSGLILTQIDMEEYSRLGHAESYYHSHYRNYYNKG